MKIIEWLDEQIEYFDEEHAEPYRLMKQFIEGLDKAEQDQDEAWGKLLDEFGGICMYAPLHEPDRRNHILKVLKSKYHLTIK